MKRVEIFCLFMMIIIVSTFAIIGKSVEEEKIQQIKIGNFALPVSQQAGPLIGFGQNIPGKGVTQIFGYFDQLKGSKTNFKTVIPSVLYGITDKFSVFIELPIAAKFKFEQFSSHGPQDFIAQFEYAVYLGETSTTVNEITCVAHIAVPTGSASKVPPTGFGAPSFFLGFTASRTTPRWYYFTSMGTVLPTSHKHNKFGNQFLYQFGLGGNIAYASDKWLFNWLMELDGIYMQRSKLSGIIDCNSGGNSVLLGSSLWFATQRLFLQLGVSGFIAQHLFGSQPKEKYLLIGGIGWKF